MTVPISRYRFPYTLLGEFLYAFSDPDIFLRFYIVLGFQNDHFA